VLRKRAVTADTDLRLARYFRMSEGFFIRRAIADKLKAIRPRAA
jgi:antitoxin HigA-1